MKNWYAIYTFARSEKRVYSRLVDRGIECYIPIQNCTRQWCDRKKKVDMVVIPSYLLYTWRIRNKISAILNIYREWQIYFVLVWPPILYRIRLLMILTKCFRLLSSLVIWYTITFPGDKVRVIGGKLRGLTGDVIEVSGQYSFTCFPG